MKSGQTIFAIFLLAALAYTASAPGQEIGPADLIAWRPGGSGFRKAKPKVERINDANYKEKVAQRGIVVVEFGATWCVPCAAMKPELQALAEEMPDVKFFDIDIDDDAETAKGLGVNEIPVLLIFKDGQRHKWHTGGTTRDVIRGLIDEVKKARITR